MQHNIEDIKTIIDENNNSNVLFVIKGFDLNTLGYAKINLANVIENPLGRMMELAANPVKVVSYEEFICFYAMALAQYKRIFIIEDASYDILYPLNCIVPENISQSLIAHYDEDYDKNTELIDSELLDEYSKVFSNYVTTENGIFCSYNVNPFELDNDKIEIISIGESSEKETMADLKPKYDYSEIISYPEVSNYMHQYWGYDSFRDIKIYDMNALETGEKKVTSVSQEKIIGDMISQVENCVNGNNSRDIFVTASTGAGKSLMFQLPAMYAAEKYKLLTIVISPLIGLMNDQVQALNRKGYAKAKTINSDISPIIKDDILKDVANGKCDILYLSPESLLSRSDITELIGNRRIGLVIVDEAHIVTTWGKQFRPDYWYLGDYISKLRSTQCKAIENPMPFIIATFTATAIYGGNEDMYTETINSLHMIDPISYLGYIRRENLSIDVSEVEAIRNKTEYRLDKFDSLNEQIKLSIMRNRKILIYFPTVRLIEDYYSYCSSKNLDKFVAKYHGKMKSEDKNENFNLFLTGEKPVMIATKAFGMGIDIPDIATVMHFAPTGNVCDYMQEIGRAARDKSIDGHAVYQYMKNDFQHINRLHGLSRLYPSQLVKVQNKILDLFDEQRKNDSNRQCKKRNEMLIDTECFAYIFDGPNTDDNELVNKVKTAMLLIQKDYENRGITPFRMRPVPMHARGYLALDPITRNEINKRYNGAAVLKDEKTNVCDVNLNYIWERDYKRKMSFPKFKYLLYTKNPELNFNTMYQFSAAMSVEIKFEHKCDEVFDNIFTALKNVSNTSTRNNTFFSEEDIIAMVSRDAHISRFKSEGIVRVFLAALNTYKEQFSSYMNGKLFDVKVLKDDSVKYKFNPASRSFFSWIEKGYQMVIRETKEGFMYVTNETNNDRLKETLTILGVLESMGVLTFKSLGGSNSQIYLYIGSTKNLRIVKEKPECYRNKLLEMITERHKESVKMLSFLFEHNFTSDEIWEHLENYFVGILPEELK